MAEFRVALVQHIINQLRAVALSGDLTLGQSLDCALVADEIERLRDLCYEAQEFITHDKNCHALMGWAKDCSCGYDEMWRKLNV